jgi:hypothetical protein
MTTKIQTISAIIITTVFSLLLISGCGNSGKKGPTFHDIPQYPNSVKKESMQQSSLMNIVKARLEQFTTEDSFDDVNNFYTRALKKLNPRIQSHSSELGQQTAMLIKQKNGGITVAIQEFRKDGKVIITIMRVGK